MDAWELGTYCNHLMRQIKSQNAATLATEFMIKFRTSVVIFLAGIEKDQFSESSPRKKVIEKHTSFSSQFYLVSISGFHFYSVSRFVLY